MAKLKFTVHPLFIAFGIYFAFTGKVFSFLVFTFTALIHELGHSYVAAGVGYKLNRIVLMPYGATVSGEIGDLTYVDEIKIALAGPLINLFVALLFVGLWWLVPNSYPYTELAVVASITIATVNLLPAFPLDGGRILLSTLSLYLPQKTARIISKSFGILLSAALFAIFIYSVFTTVNFSMLFFALFVLFGNVCVSKDNRYVRLINCFTLGDLKKGKIIKSAAISPKTTVNDLLKLQSPGQILECVIFDFDETEVCRLSGDKVIVLLQEGNLSRSVYSEANRLGLFS